MTILRAACLIARLYVFPMRLNSPKMFAWVACSYSLASLASRATASRVERKSLFLVCLVIDPVAVARRRLVRILAIAVEVAEKLVEPLFLP